jgi:hypothetical protein
MRIWYANRLFQCLANRAATRSIGRNNCNEVFDGRAEASNGINAEPGIEQQTAKGRNSEQPGMGKVENTAAAVIEMSEQQNEANGPKGDVARAREQLSARSHYREDPMRRQFWGLHVLQHIQREHCPETRIRQAAGPISIQVVLDSAKVGMSGRDGSGFIQMRKSTERPQVCDVGSSVKFDPAEPEKYPAGVVFRKLEALYGKTWPHTLGDGKASQRIAEDLHRRVVENDLARHQPGQSRILFAWTLGATAELRKAA